MHTGQTGAGAGMRGGNGLRLKYSNPIHLDDVAVDFPDMPIVMAHPSFPWQEEALAVATHKPNVYIDLSGWSPKYFPPIHVRYANTLLREKVLFGFDWPMITPERWLADFEKIEIKDENRPLILKQNAARLLGLRWTAGRIAVRGGQAPLPEGGWKLANGEELHRQSVGGSAQGDAGKGRARHLTDQDAARLSQYHRPGWQEDNCGRSRHRADRVQAVRVVRARRPLT